MCTDWLQITVFLLCVNCTILAMACILGVRRQGDLLLSHGPYLVQTVSGTVVYEDATTRRGR